MDQFGLSQKTIDAVCSILSTFPQIETAVIYGSRAKGNYRNGSDIDLCLKGQNIDLNLLWSLDEPIDELYLPYTFDISIYSQIENKDLLEHIDRVGKIFYNLKAII